MAFETHQADMDPAPLFQGLPQEVYTAGDAYYGAPGHLPLLFAGPNWSSSARPAR